VLWSTHSVESDWVKEEAEEARAVGKLIPVLIEPVKPPVGFRSIQAADLINWDGSRDFVGARQLIADLESRMAKSPPRKLSETEEAARKSPSVPQPSADESRVVNRAAINNVDSTVDSTLAESSSARRVESTIIESDRKSGTKWKMATVGALIV